MARGQLATSPLLGNLQERESSATVTSKVICNQRNPEEPTSMLKNMCSAV